MTQAASDWNEEHRSSETFGSKILAKIIDASPIPSFVIDAQHKVTHWNTAMQALSGIAADDVLSTDEHWRAFYSEKRPILADLIADGAEYREIESLYAGKCRKSPLIDGAYEVEDFFPDLNETGRWLHFTASPIKDGSTTIGVIETLQDVTQRKLAEENLHYYVKAFTTAQEDARKRIARDLHDDTLQVLGSVSRQIDIFVHSNHALEAYLTDFLKDIQDQLNIGAQNVHRFSQALRLSVLDDFGLIPAIRSVLKRLQDHGGGKADLRVIGNERRLSSEAETALFRIIQEGVNNIRKHALPCDTSVVLDFASDRVLLTITDNGRGFDLTESVDSLPRRGKLGLAGMQERAHLLGGTFEVASSLGKGTTLTIGVPGSPNGSLERTRLSD